MTNIAPRKWDYEEECLLFDMKYRVHDGDIDIALVQEEKYARLIASAPELYWIAYNLLFELKRGNDSNPEYIKQAIPQIEDLLNRIQGVSEQLKPCPFCGSKFLAIVNLISPSRYYIKCLECDTRAAEVSKKQQAVEAWNRRAYDNAQAI